MEKLLHHLYYDVDSPACFASATTLYHHAKLSLPSIKYKNVVEFLEAQHPYSLHKQSRVKFPRNKVIAIGLDSHWQADLCDMQKLQYQNGRHKYILTMVDVLSKYGFAEPVKNKTPSAVCAGFKAILERSKRKPWYLMTDKGNEFRGCFKAFVDDYDIIHYMTQSPDVKASNVERWNRTLKTRLWKYFTHNRTKKYTDVLQKIVDSLNNRYCRPIGMRPSAVSFDNEQEVWRRLYGSMTPKLAKFKYKTGDRVRIAVDRATFRKGYLPRFTDNTFIITECLARVPPVYRVKHEDDGEPVEGIFYHEELSRAA